MVLKRIGFGAALFGSVLALLHLSPGVITEWMLAADDPLPVGNSLGESVVIVRSLLDAGAFAVGFGGVFLLGYWAGSRVMLRHRYRQLLATLGVGGALGYVLVLVLFLSYSALAGGDLPDVTGGVTSLLVFASRATAITVQFAVVGIAGASIAELMGGSSRPAGPSAGRSE